MHTCRAGTIELSTATWKPIGGTVTIVNRRVRISTGTQPRSLRAAMRELSAVANSTAYT
jgi:hypothetical protein